MIPRTNKMITTREDCLLNQQDWVITVMASRELLFQLSMEQLIPWIYKSIDQLSVCVVEEDIVCEFCYKKFYLLKPKPYKEVL